MAQGGERLEDVEDVGRGFPPKGAGEVFRGLRGRLAGEEVADGNDALDDDLVGAVGQMLVDVAPRGGRVV